MPVPRALILREDEVEGDDGGGGGGGGVGRDGGAGCRSTDGRLALV